MELSSRARVIMTVVAVILSYCVDARKGKTAYCGACKAVIDELKYSISKEDPHKTIEMGDFRIDSQGKQNGIKQMKYAGSEMHVSELLENICDNMQNYGETSDPKTGKKGYMRINSRNGETITISNINFSSGGMEELKIACDNFVSDHDDDIIQLLQEDQLTKDDLVFELCTDIAGYCDNGQDVHYEL